MSTLPPPPIAPKPISAYTPNTTNGATTAAHKNSLLEKRDRTSINAKERDSLTASIKSSHARRLPIDFDAGDEHHTNGYASDEEAIVDEADTHQHALDVTARDSRDEVPPPPARRKSRPDKPYTLNTPIDFDGLSWPSKPTALPSKSA